MDDRRFLLKYNDRENFYHRCVCVQVKCENQMQKIFFHIISQVGLSELSHTAWYLGTQVTAQSLKTRQQNDPKLEILQTAIRYVWLLIFCHYGSSYEKKKKKKIRRNKNYVTYRIMIILI